MSRWILPAVLVLAVGVAVAQERDSGRSAAFNPAYEELPDEFYFTKPMVRWFIEEMTDKVGKQLGMDPEQLERTREQFEATLPTFLAERRGELQPVLNEFVSIWTGKESPAPEKVADWAKRALPIFDEFKSVMVETSESLRPFLTDDQNVILDGNLAAFDVGTRFAREKLETWTEGQYNPVTDWHRSPQHRAAMREEERLRRAEEEYARAIAMGENPPLPPEFDQKAAAAGAEGGAAKPQIVEAVPRPPLPAGSGSAVSPVADPWKQYVDEFIERYRLDEAQRSKAYQFLAEAQSQRDRWKERIAERVARLEKLVANAKTQGGKAEAELKIKELNAPFDRQFNTLKERLDRLPTRKQKETGDRAVGQPPAAAAGDQR